MELWIELRQSDRSHLIFNGRSEDYPSLPRVGDRMLLQDETFVIENLKYSFEVPDRLRLVLTGTLVKR